MNSTFLMLLLFGSNKQLYIKPEAIIGVYDVDCVIQATGQVIEPVRPCVAVVTIGQEYQVYNVKAVDIVNVLRGKKK